MPSRGRVTVFAIITYVLAAIGLVGLVLVLGGGLHRVGKIPDQVEVRGPFELVTHTGYRDQYYSARYRGKPFSVDGRANEYDGSTIPYRYFNSLITFGDVPAAVVHVGDPNNTGYFYLIHEVDGKARADYLNDSRSGVSVNWLDGSEGGGTRSMALHRGQFGAGRWLLLGDQCVLDTRTLHSYRFDLPNGYYLSPFKASLGLSPDERSFVRLASASDDAEHLLVIRFTDGHSYALPIDRATMRFHEIEELDSAWVQHHFVWTPTSDGDVLEVYPGFTPLPYRGKLTTDRESGYREYQLPPCSPAMFDVMVEFAIRELQATRTNEAGHSSTAELLLDGASLHIAYYTDYATAYAPHGESSEAVLLFARKFDEALQSGRYDEHFVRSL